MPTDHADAPDSPTLIDELRPFMTGATAGIPSDSGVHLLFRVLAKATLPAPEDVRTDTRVEDIQREVEGATPETRTRAAQVATALIPILKRVRSVILAVKEASDDNDVSRGDAEVLPDGWLVVRMDGAEIARLPFNPERTQADAARIAEDLLAEHVKLHVLTARDADATSTRTVHVVSVATP